MIFFFLLNINLIIIREPLLFIVIIYLTSILKIKTKNAIKNWPVAIKHICWMQTNTHTFNIWGRRSFSYLFYTLPSFTLLLKIKKKDIRNGVCVEAAWSFYIFSFTYSYHAQ